MIPLISQFNKFSLENKSIIQKALTTATDVGAALIPQNLEEIMTDTVIRLSPEMAMVTPKVCEGNLHEFNQVKSRPAPGGAMGEAATTPGTNSKTSRKSVTLKIVRRKGIVTEFLKDTSRKYIDAQTFEMQQHIQAQVLDLIIYMMYGNADGNTYEFDGLDKFIGSSVGASAPNRVNAAYGGVVPSTLSTLDGMLDQSNTKGGARHRRAFGMSPQMLSKFSGLLTNVRLNQGLAAGGFSQVDVNGGWRLNAYRDIPIIETTAVRPIQSFTPVLTISQGTGGSIVNGTYILQVSAVTWEGEQIASAETPVTITAGGGTASIHISLDAANVDASLNKNAIQYRIYCTAMNGAAKSETLRKIVSAFLYDSDGTKLTTNNGVDADIVLTSLTPGTDVPASMQADVPLVQTGSISPEIVYLWDLDPIQGLGKLPYTNTAGDQFNGLVTTTPLAPIDDYIHFLVKSYCALCPSFEQTSFWYRGLRTA